jgi:hypothetical protein
MADQPWARIGSIPGLDTSKLDRDVRSVDLGTDGVRMFLDALGCVTDRIRGTTADLDARRATSRSRASGRSTPRAFGIRA